MTRQLIFLITLLNSCVMYHGTSELFEKNQIEDVQLHLNGYFYHEDELDHKIIDGELIMLDSTKEKVVTIRPLMLFSDGSFHKFIGVTNRKAINKNVDNEDEAYWECHRLLQESLSNNDGHYQYTWGVYNIADDTIKLQNYEIQGAFPLPFTSRILMEMRGIINNDSTFTLFQFINHGNDFLDSLDEEYKFMPFETKLDSTKWDMDIKY